MGEIKRSDPIDFFMTNAAISGSFGVDRFVAA